jgi:hypothetical protein
LKQKEREGGRHSKEEALYKWLIRCSFNEDQDNSTFLRDNFSYWRQKEFFSFLNTLKIVENHKTLVYTVNLCISFISQHTIKIESLLNAWAKRRQERKKENDKKLDWKIANFFFVDQNKLASLFFTINILIIQKKKRVHHTFFATRGIIKNLSSWQRLQWILTIIRIRICHHLTHPVRIITIIHH